MSYTINPYMPQVRADAVSLVKCQHWPMRKVARRFGVNVGTVSRWCERDVSSGRYPIPTRSSRPKTSPTALTKEVVAAIVQKRIGRRRCGQHIFHELKREGIMVSLPSVQRTLDRLKLLKKRSVWKRPHDITPRPICTHAGALLQADTVHIMAPDGTKIYVYTLISFHVGHMPKWLNEYQLVAVQVF